MDGGRNRSPFATRRPCMRLGQRLPGSPHLEMSMTPVRTAALALTLATTSAALADAAGPPSLTVTPAQIPYYAAPTTPYGRPGITLYPPGAGLPPQLATRHTALIRRAPRPASPVAGPARHPHPTPPVSPAPATSLMAARPKASFTDSVHVALAQNRRAPPGAARSARPRPPAHPTQHRWPPPASPQSPRSPGPRQAGRPAPRSR